MPKTRRYTVPKGIGWSGGVIGGGLSFESGDDPWVVRFTDGAKVEKREKFKVKDHALEWRRKYSNETGRTNNAWRHRIGDTSIVEMTLPRGRIVIYDAEFLPKFSQFVWAVDKFDRVYTTRRVITSQLGINDEEKKDRWNRRGRHHRQPTRQLCVDRRISQTSCSREAKGQATS